MTDGGQQAVHRAVFPVTGSNLKPLTPTISWSLHSDSVLVRTMAPILQVSELPENGSECFPGHYCSTAVLFQAPTHCLDHATEAFKDSFPWISGSLSA